MKKGDPFIFTDAKYKVIDIGKVDLIDNDRLVVVFPETGEIREMLINNQYSVRHQIVSSSKSPGSRITEARRQSIKSLFIR